MLYSEIVVGCSEIRTKRINTLFLQNVEFMNDESGGAKSKVVNTCWKQKINEQYHFLRTLLLFRPAVACVLTIQLQLCPMLTIRRVS